MKRLYWQCRRGLLELDEILQAWLLQYERLSLQEQRCFQALLQESDTDLYQWLFENQPIPQHYQALITKLNNKPIAQGRNHVISDQSRR